ncbi:hypothetical protein N5T95_08880 [Aliarcobacter cryaerophilus]|uniref:hypothetical protein n=1 Tax=Aliarcobacter cryaerophilus TaxID=28198 RepID=UPI00112F4CD9|nr:hypothetical protein [Aliarcobacter cryaerophilus]MCT7535631.1 hypothetical protein [Aliarcobacter cryaerophilus]
MKNMEFDNFIDKIKDCLQNKIIGNFTYDNVKILELNNKYIFLWQDVKGQVCYCFDILDNEYFTTSASKLGNVLSQYFQCEIEVVNNDKEHLKKIVNAQGQLNRAITDSERYYTFNSYNGDLSYSSNDLSYSKRNLNTSSIIPSNYNHPLLNQEALYNGIIKLSTYNLESHIRTIFIKISELPIVYKTLFRPNINKHFFDERNMNCKNSYIPSKYQVLNLHEYDYDIENSFIIDFIFFMARDSGRNAKLIFKWLLTVIISRNKNKYPYPLVLHGNDESCMKLFLEEIVEPLLNPKFCEKFTNDTMDEKSLLNKLNEKIIYNFHNITTLNILNLTSNEFLNKLIDKDDLIIGNKTITTLAHILITSTTKYIPLMDKKNIFTCFNIPSIDILKLNYMEAVRKIRSDLINFYTILKHIDSDMFYRNNGHFVMDDNGLNFNILDSNTDILDTFENIIKNKDIVPFDNLKNQNKKLYNKLVEDFGKNRVDRKNLFEYFTCLFGESIYKNNNQLIKVLRDLSDTKEPFGNMTTFNNNGRVYYRL